MSKVIGITLFALGVLAQLPVCLLGAFSVDVGPLSYAPAILGTLLAVVGGFMAGLGFVRGLKQRKSSGKQNTNSPPANPPPAGFVPVCNRCGALPTPGMRFCTRCGNSLQF
jgi:hypothetical protein